MNRERHSVFPGGSTCKMLRSQMMVLSSVSITAFKKKKKGDEQFCRMRAIKTHKEDRRMERRSLVVSLSYF